MARDRDDLVSLGLRGQGVDADRAQDAPGARTEERQHGRRASREADRGGDPVVLERPSAGADPVEVGLEQDDVLLDEDAQRGPAPRPSRCSSAARQPWPGGRPATSWLSIPCRNFRREGPDASSTARSGEVHEGRALARGRVLARGVAVGGDDRLAASLAEAGAARDVRVVERQVGRGRHRASLAPSRGVVENDSMSLTPSAANAAEIAAMAVPVVEENYGVTLDYGVASLKQLDGIIDDLRRDQRFEALQPLLFSMGCYVGEVLVRHAGGRWRITEELGMGVVASSPIAIEMPDGRGCNPVGRVYKRFQKGREDGLAAFYQAMTGPTESDPPRPVIWARMTVRPAARTRSLDVGLQDHGQEQRPSAPRRGHHAPRRERQGLGPRRPDGRLALPLRGVGQQALLRRLAQPLRLRLHLRGDRAAAPEAEGLRPTMALRRRLALVLAAALLAPACGGSTTGPSGSRAVVSITVDPNPVPGTQSPLTGVVSVGYKVVITETNGGSGEVLFVSSQIYDPETGTQVALTYFDSSDLVVFVGSKKIEPLGHAHRAPDGELHPARLPQGRASWRSTSR